MAGRSEDPVGVGSVLDGSYRILRVIGRGGMGVVYEAEHTRLPQRLAIKVVQGDLNRQSVERFRREAEIASSLGHPNIMRVFDFNVLADGTPYMVMDYLEGVDLTDILKHGRLPIDRTIALIRQIASGLMAAHANGIVHRDLKPSNIFITIREVDGVPQEHAVILDFGISKIQDASTVLTQTEMLLGTPQYMAPEQAMGHHDRISPKTDQFALAVLTYVMLSGQRPFDGKAMHEIVYKVCHTEPGDLGALVPDLDKEVVAAVRRGMSKSPADRFDDVGAFAEALSGRPLVAVPRERKGNPAHAALESAALQDTIDSAEGPVPEAATTTLPDHAPRGASAESSTVPGRGPRPADDMPTAAGRPRHRSEKIVPAEPRGWSRRSLAIATAASAIVAALAVFIIRSQLGDVPPTHTENPPAALADASLSHAIADASPPPSATDSAPPSTTDGAPPSATAGALVEPGIDASTNEAASSSTSPEQHSSPRSPNSSKAFAKARAALDAGNYTRARQLAERAFQTNPSTEFYSLKVKSFCGEADFGTAQSWLPKVARRDRREVIAYCRAHGVNLVP